MDRALRLICILVFALGSVAPAYSGLKKNGTYSPEWEFSNSKLKNDYYGENGELHVGKNESNVKAQKEWAGQMRRICAQTKDCTVEEIASNRYAFQDKEGDVYYDSKGAIYPDYRVKYKDGFYYDITLDPGTIEIKLKPMLVAQAKKQQKRMQGHIFDVAKKIGLSPPRTESSQIHMGVEAAFGPRNEMTEAFRNFMQAMVSEHQGMWILWIEDLQNAPPLATLPESQTLAFEAIIEDIDAGLIKDYPTFCKRMKRDVYGETFDADMVTEFDKANKFHAVNVNRLCKRFEMFEKTIEFRSLPPQKTAQDFIDLIVLLDGILNTHHSYKGKRPKKRFDFNRRKYRTWINDVDKLITEAGLDPKIYRRFLRPKYRDACAIKVSKDTLKKKP